VRVTQQSPNLQIAGNSVKIPDRLSRLSRNKPAGTQLLSKNLDGRQRWGVILRDLFACSPGRHIDWDFCSVSTPLLIAVPEVSQLKVEGAAHGVIALDWHERACVCQECVEVRRAHSFGGWVCAAVLLTPGRCFCLTHHRVRPTHSRGNKKNALAERPPLGCGRPFGFQRRTTVEGQEELLTDDRPSAIQWRSGGCTGSRTAICLRDDWSIRPMLVLFGAARERDRSDAGSRASTNRPVQRGPAV